LCYYDHPLFISLESALKHRRRMTAGFTRPSNRECYAVQVSKSTLAR